MFGRSVAWVSPRHAGTTTVLLGLLTGAAATSVAAAQESTALFPGVAVIRTANDEHTVPILCDDAARPELGFSTEPSRVTRERTGQTSRANVRLRAWQDTELVVLSLDGYVTWLPRPSSAAGVLTVATDMSRISVVRDGVPSAYTFDMWNSGERPADLQGVTIEARCGLPAPVSPSSQRNAPA